MLAQAAQTADSQTVVYPLGHSWLGRNAGQSWSCRRCVNHVRYEVRPGDRTASDIASGNPAERSELIGFDSGTTIVAPYDTDIWLSLAMRLPSGARTPADVNHWAIVGQFHPTFGPGDATDLSPVWLQQFNPNDVLTVYTRSATTSPLLVTPAPVNRYSFTFPRDTWVRFVYRLQFNQSGGGQMDIYKDGSSVYSAATPLGYNEPTGPYFQFGIYRAADTATAVVEYANVEYSQSSLLGRVSTPLPLP